MIEIDRGSGHGCARRRAGPRNCRLTFARPKSRIFACPRLVRNKFAGLEIAMHDAGGVRDFERIGDLHAEIQQLLDRHRLTLNAVLQGGAFEELHHDEVATILLRRCRKWCRYWGGSAPTRRAPRAGSAHGLGIVGQFVGQKLESDATTEAKILGLIDHAHAATTQLLQDPVVRDGLSEHETARGCGSPCILGGVAGEVNAEA